jgi:FKBP-type peptidyl-prolyl cis-trans isomerase FkpA
MIKNAILLFAFCWFCFSCNKNTCDENPPSTIASAAEIKVLQDFITANGIIATQHASGLFYRILSQGSGANPNQCSSITVRYKGTLLSGSTFDQSTTNVSFLLNQLIAGWKLALPLLQKGGKIMLYIPPSLGYGSSSQSGIPANSSLIFDIDLIGVEN